MRLSKIKEILDTALPKLQFLGNQTGQIAIIQPTTQLREALQEIIEIEPLEKGARELLALVPVTSASGNSSVSINVFNEITQKLTALTLSCRLLAQVLHKATPNIESGTVYLRLPERSELASLAEDVKSLATALNQVFAGKPENLTFTLKGFDTGSEWLVLLVKPLEHIGKFYYFIKAALSLASKEVELKKQKEELRRMSIQNDMLEKYAKIHDELLVAVTDSMAREFIQKIGKNPADPSNNEELTRVVNALNTVKTVFTSGGGLEFPKITFVGAKDVQTDMKAIEADSIALAHQVKALLEHKR